jgi:protoheme IX farnesyltransferase
MFSAYYYLAKPGIVYGNLIAALAGFLYASHFVIEPVVLFSMIVGLGLMIGGACVFNNYLDRDMDRAMSRTRTRALAAGSISVVAALAYGVALTCFGFAVLLWGTNSTAALTSLAGLLVYVCVYTPLKRISYHATLVGAVSGAVPILVGYVAVSGSIDMDGWILFAILAVWQMPHFYAIAIFRSEEYASAHVPVVSLVRGVAVAERYMRMYIVLFAGVVALPTYTGVTGSAYLVVVWTACAWWLWRARGSVAVEPALRARTVFGSSLAVLLIVCGALSIGPLLP